MERPEAALYQLQELTTEFGAVERNHYVLGTERRENDLEHSFSVAMLSWYVLSRHNLDLDAGKVLKYSLAHDFVEVYAGDTNTFASEEERASKLERERIALHRLSSEFTSFPELVDTLEEYESKETPEALFVWTVDKIQALVLGELDHWRPYAILDISYESFCNKYAELLSQSAPEIKQIFESIIEYSKTTYYARPKE